MCFSLKPLQNLIFLIVIKNKFLNFQLVIFLEFVNSEVLQRSQPEKYYNQLNLIEIVQDNYFISR